MLNEAIQLAKSDAEPEFWIHSAAVLDYQPECKSGKIPSGSDNLIIELLPTKKHLQALMEHAGEKRRIGFKLEVGVDEEMLISKSKELITENNLEAVVANLLEEAHGHSQKRCRIVHSDGRVEGIQDLEGLCEAIERLITSK